MKIPLSLALAGMLVIFSTQARADINYKQYLELSHQKESGRTKYGFGALTLDYWLDGAATGISWAYAAEPGRTGKTFCLPVNLAVTGEVVGSAIKQLLEQRPDLKKDDSRMGAVTILAIQTAFPCPK